MCDILRGIKSTKNHIRYNITRSREKLVKQFILLLVLTLNKFVDLQVCCTGAKNNNFNFKKIPDSRIIR